MALGIRNTVFHPEAQGRTFCQGADLSANCKENQLFQRRSWGCRAIGFNIAVLITHHLSPAMRQKPDSSDGNQEGRPDKPPDEDGLRKHNGSEYPQASWTLQVGFGLALQRHSSACWAPWSWTAHKDLHQSHSKTWKSQRRTKLICPKKKAHTMKILMFTPE